MSKCLALVLLLLSFGAKAATFVGNGGNAGDLELAITLAEIHQTMDEMPEEEASLCRCAKEFADNKLCEVLRSLNEAQRKLCQETLSNKAEELQALADRNSSIRITWSDEPLFIRSGSGQESPRLVDAVTQADKKSIVLNRPRFLEMPASFRIALVTHELFHLLPVGKSRVSDDEPVGPFKDGKSFLDVLGAATAMAANEAGVVLDFAPLAKVSRAYRPFLLQVDLKHIVHSEKAAKDLLKKDSSDSVDFGLSYKIKGLGLRLGIESIYHEEKRVSVVRVEEQASLYYVGLGYHWLPVDAYLSRWSELQVSLFIDAVWGDFAYQVSDEALTIKDKAKGQGTQGSVQVHLPLVYDFWGILAYQVRSLRYVYKELGVHVNDVQQVISLGGAYAF